MPRATAWATKKRAAQVGVENGIPVVPGHIERRLANVAAGVVDQDIDLAEVRLDGRHRSLNAGMIAHVQIDRKCLSAERLNFRGERRQGPLVAAGDGQIGPGAGQRARKILAQATAGTGHQRDSS